MDHFEFDRSSIGGLTTKEAVHKLHKDIEDFLEDFEPNLKSFQSWRKIISDAYSHNSIYSTFRWTSCLFLIISIITYLIAFKMGHFTSSTPLAIEIFTLILVLIINKATIYLNSRSRHFELFLKAQKLSKRIKTMSDDDDLMKRWSEHIHFANLNAPQSPCISLQWTYRDGRLVNLPVSLLVEGDLILLNPGHRSPAKCRKVSKIISDSTNHCFSNETQRKDMNYLGPKIEYEFSESFKETTLNRGDIFVAFNDLDQSDSTFTTPRFRRCLRPSKFLITETPYIQDLEQSLQSQMHRKSPTAFEKELRLIFVHCLEHLFVPIIYFLSLIVSIVHYSYVESSGSHFDTGSATIALILLRPVMIILPLLPLALPFLWFILNNYGIIKLNLMYNHLSRNEGKFSESKLSLQNQESFDEDSFDSLNNIHNHLTAEFNLYNSNLNNHHCTQNDYHKNQSMPKNDDSSKKRKYYLDEIDPDIEHLSMDAKLLLQNFLRKFSFLQGDDRDNLWRTANLLHVLGSITALCCVDKKGILSWPNPVADKVFFLSSPKTVAYSRNKTEAIPEGDNLMNEEENNAFDETIPNATNQSKSSDKRHSMLQPLSRAECVQLDITLDKRTEYGLQFDDIYWSRYLSNLKPLGLAILLNTCNQATQEEFIHFNNHIACESLSNEVAVPVVSKRCLCELARQIGFKENAIKDYEYCYQVAIFRHIRPEMIQKGKLAKSLNFSRLRMPLPNMTCAVIRDTYSNQCQLFSQGTGDLILDTCAEYWNGQSLVLLTDYERKKILDFYQRSSLTSYCCSFAYIPLIETGNDVQTSQSSSTSINNTFSSNEFYRNYFLELPPDSSHLFPSQRSLDAHLRGLGMDFHYSYSNVNQNIPGGNEFFDSTTNLNLNSKLAGHHLSSDLTLDQSYDSMTRMNLNDPSKDWKETMKSTNDDRKSSPVFLQHQFNTNRSQQQNIIDDDQHDDDKSMKLLLNQTMKKIVNEVFIGMATLQYQACSDFVRLVELLDSACIRFVHFSKENELRSRVFSEKMGLESGWNCHISLLNDPIASANLQDQDSVDNNENSKPKQTVSDNIDSSESSSGSDLEESCMNQNQDDFAKQQRRKHNSVCSDRSETIGLRSYGQKSREFRSSSKISGISTSNPHRNLSPSPSRNTTASTMTEHSAPIAFDMSNRAKLPKGIANIRPHLENVDNVPLLVSLFTDCTPEATKEMIKIMQEYEEVVCVIGSMANESNMPIFLQADASIGINPMYPHVCLTEPIFPVDPFRQNDPGELNPINLANELIALPCSIKMQRHNAIIFYYLILIARDYMMRMRNLFQFFLSSCLSLTLAQMIASLLFLPPLFSPGIVIWLSLIFIPFLSISLMGIKPDPSVMNVATGKKLHLNKETLVYFFVCYIIKFIPSILICVIIFAIIIQTSCERTKVGRSTLGPCWMFSDVKADGDIKTDLIWSSHLLIGQTIASFFLVLYLVIISIGFVHRNYLLWQRCPFVNYCWLLTSFSLIILHLFVCLLEIYIYVPEVEITEQFIQIIPFYIWIIGFTWPILLISINLFAKRREIKMNNRQQRRARLDFGTKLGMNSPF
ncbi:hypothetical protein NH340_JMT01150 [Sarcoptes scabiei]|nr:hypothetical protein NH340_JMT01150 [Sarcoptes scabiei]